MTQKKQKTQNWYVRCLCSLPQDIHADTQQQQYIAKFSERTHNTNRTKKLYMSLFPPSSARRRRQKNFWISQFVVGSPSCMVKRCSKRFIYVRSIGKCCASSLSPFSLSFRLLLWWSSTVVTVCSVLFILFGAQHVSSWHQHAHHPIVFLCVTSFFYLLLCSLSVLHTTLKRLRSFFSSRFVNVTTIYFSISI